jgi:hypothetical protein
MMVFEHLSFKELKIFGHNLVVLGDKRGTVNFHLAHPSDEDCSNE